MGCCQKGCPHTYHYACAVDTGEPRHWDWDAGTPPASSDPADGRAGWSGGSARMVMISVVCVPNLANFS